MNTATRPNAANFLGLGSAQALKAHAMKVNERQLRTATTVVLVCDQQTGGDLYLLARSNKGDSLYVILPDSKQLCPARYREQRKDLAFIFEVLA